MQLNSSARPSGLSVVIPTLNRIEMVARACQSVRSTHLDRVEIIVIDDGSNEDLRQQLPMRNDWGIPIRCYRFMRNRGPQAARNLGIRRARFSHIAFLDSDDAFTPEKIDLVLEQLDNGPVDLLFHGVQGMPKYGKLARLWTGSLSRWLPFGWWIALLNPVVTPTLVIRRERRLGVVRLRHCEDWCFLLRYVQPDTRICFLQQELSIVYRPVGTSGGLSSAIWKMRKGEFAARQVLLKSPWPSGLPRYCLGGMAGLLRITSDVLRGRYFR
ncbi:Glycosyl transferase family 2 [Cupriavidus sp. OV038]|jgi:glycosyltransferase involved in cell wall biosynthesis|uniref:glycosyltransferase family 2 protein n=1 Tax=unclassified Cupriavidus TaxID=2640874 RepID=UPI0008E37300|nr:MULTISPECIES: glycosyltransferase family 2 protein [unclassified Cupriavidus]SFB78748.1 Glycosyl transferase family 2 [Cupriavidus sp. OV038]SFO65687.1 Glycosyl transferase family 2 [Cupriavidus sp. OV096]